MGVLECSGLNKLNLSAGVLTSPSFAQFEPETRSGSPFTHRFEIRVVTS